MKQQQTVLLAIVVFLVGICSAQNYPNTVGKEFVLGFLRNYDNSGSSNNLELFISSEKNTTVTITSNYANFTTQNINITAGTVSIVDLPVKMRCVSGVVEDKGVLISSTEDVSVVGLNQLKSTTDAFLAIPTDIQGSTSFRAVSYYTNSADGSTQIGVFALKDNTEVTVTYSQSSSLSGTKTITLNALQSYVFEDAVNAKDLTGSLITSNKPISVFGAHWCADIPLNKNYCDILVEQLIPLSTWGQTYYTAPLATRKGGDIFRVVADKDSTSVYVNGELKGVIDAGEFIELDLNSTSYNEIKASAAVLVAQYSKGSSVDNTNSDPFMMILPAKEQYESGYRFNTPNSGTSFKNYVSVIIRANQVGGLLFNGAALSSNITWNQIYNTSYVATSFAVKAGTNTLFHQSSIVQFGISVYGYANDDSYGYIGGMRLTPIALDCVATVCGVGDGYDNDCDGLVDEELANGIDEDGDGLIDEDVAIGQPFCISCGDFICDATETCVSCSHDCGDCCGNGVCDTIAGENCENCEDCLCCGDGVCQGKETCSTCPKDCPTASPTAVTGCTVEDAENYNPSATVDDYSCVYAGYDYILDDIPACPIAIPKNQCLTRNVWMESEDFADMRLTDFEFGIHLDMVGTGYSVVLTSPTGDVFNLLPDSTASCSELYTIFSSDSAPASSAGKCTYNGNLEYQICSRGYPSATYSKSLYDFATNQTLSTTPSGNWTIKVCTSSTTEGYYIKSQLTYLQYYRVADAFVSVPLGTTITCSGYGTNDQTFVFPNSFGANLEVGSIINGGDCNGILSIVRSVSVGETQTTVTANPTGLDSVFYIANYRAVKGLQVTNNTLKREIVGNFDLLFSETYSISNNYTKGPVTVGGTVSITFELKAVMEIKIGYFSLNSMLLRLDGSVTPRFQGSFDINQESEGETSFEIPFIPTLKSKLFFVQIGPVTIPVQLAYATELGLAASLKSKVHLDWDASITGAVYFGEQYTKEKGLLPIYGSSIVPSFTYNYSQACSVEGSISIIPKLTLAIFGLDEDDEEAKKRVLGTSLPISFSIAPGYHLSLTTPSPNNTDGNPLCCGERSVYFEKWTDIVGALSASLTVFTKTLIKEKSWTLFNPSWNLGHECKDTSTLAALGCLVDTPCTGNSTNATTPNGAQPCHSNCKSDSKKTVLANVNGDPHFKNYDHCGFSFQGTGDYILTEAGPVDGDKVTIHMRFGLRKGQVGTGVTYVTGIAFRNSLFNDILEYVYENGESTLRLNGQKVTLNQCYFYFRGGYVHIHNTYHYVYFDSGERFTVKIRESSGTYGFINSLTGASYGLTSGLLGVWNGDRTDDFVNGAVGSVKDCFSLTAQEVYDVGLTWRITSAEESLFTYFNGDTPNTFYHPEYTPTFPTQINDSLLIQLNARCSGVPEDFRNDCVFDLLNDPDFVDLIPGTAEFGWNVENSNVQPQNFVVTQQVKVSNQRVPVYLTATWEDPSPFTILFDEKIYYYLEYISVAGFNVAITDSLYDAKSISFTLTFDSTVSLPRTVLFRVKAFTASTSSDYAVYSLVVQPNSALPSASPTSSPTPSPADPNSATPSSSPAVNNGSNSATRSPKGSVVPRPPNSSSSSNSDSSNDSSSSNKSSSSSSDASVISVTVFSAILILFALLF